MTGMPPRRLDPPPQCPTEDEPQRIFVHRLYAEILGRTPDQGGLDAHTASLAEMCTATKIKEIVDRFHGSGEYTNRSLTTTQIVESLYRGLSRGALTPAA